MKKRILSLLCMLCLILGLLPTAAMAAGTSTAPEKIYICGMELTDGKCLVDNSATVTNYTSGDYVALYKDGVLYLNGLSKTYAGIADGYRTLNWDYSNSGKHDLVIELVEGSVNTLVDTNYGAINGASGMSDGPSLTIQGKGTLNVTGGTYAIWVWEGVTIQNGATVNAAGGTQSGISINSTSGAITVKQGTTVTTSGTYGISGSNGRTVKFNIEGGNLVVKGTEQALYNTAANIDSAIDVYVSGMTDPTQASDVTTWNKTDNLVSNNYKYISLSGFSSTVTTYNVTKAATSNGSFEIDCPDKSMAAETVTITATPNDGYEVDTVTITDGDSGTVTVSGEGNTRTFTMPEKAVTVAVTFKPTTYTITYNLNEGTNASGNPATYTVETDDIILKAPSKSGYTFGGWFDNAGLTGTAVTTIAKGSTGNKEYWAKWTQNQTAALEDVTFNYAYDVQRNPAYPAKDNNITASSLTKPLDADGTTSCASNEGNWTLTRAGTYAYVKSLGNDSANLQGVVNNIVSNYTGITADEVVLHELKNGDKHIAYGVVVAYDAEMGIAIYLGGNRAGGAGYLLSVDAQSGTVNAKAGMIATDFVPQQSISIDKSGTHTFENKTFGYAAQTPVTVTISNAGNTATGALNVTLSGANASSFTLGDVDDTLKAGIALNGSETFTVVPNTGLSAGTYTATVTVSGVNVASQSFTTSFTVSAPTTYDVTVQNDGYGTASADPTSGAAGTEITLSASPSTGYKFKEWQVVTNNVTITDNKFEMPSSDVTVKAIFEKETYTISWDTDGDGDVDDTTNVAYGDTPTHADGSKTEDAQYTYTFTGWDTTITPATGAQTYTAQFTPVARSYGVTLNANGGTVNNGDVASYTYGTGATLPTDVTKENYTFAGWFDNAELNGTAVTAISATETGDKTFYAKWTYTGGSYYPTTYAVVVEDADNGEVSASTTAAYRGTTVTIQVAPDKGYTLETLTATDRSGKEIELTKVSDSKYTFKMPASKVTVQATFMEDNTMLNFFVDVPADAYYYDAVLWAAKNGITEGTSATTFSPDMDCTRAQMVTFLWRAVGSPEPTTNVCPFTDVDLDSYYGKAVLWAVENGITKGTSATTFSPDMACSRAQMVTFICRMADGKPVSSSIAFTDVPADAYYAESVQWAVENGITNGTGDNKFSPDATCTRAQMVTFLYRYFEN